MKKCILSLLAILGASLSSTQACGNYGASMEILPVLDSGGEGIAALAAQFRQLGEAGLVAALDADAETQSHSNYAAFLDQVAKQKDALRSKLYWHTDFDQALAAAKATGRPILSLRLLGKLDEEFSCANSRLFREAIYPDRDVNAMLRENFILHWKSVRPVPVMTIDFGDGRTLKRTITGNSVHYVLDSSGQVIDALPGLYTPEKFLEHLDWSRQLVSRRLGCRSTLALTLPSDHRSKLEALREAFTAELERCGIRAKLSDPIEMSDLTAEEWARLAAVTLPPREALIPAALANRLTVGKGMMETPLIEVVSEADLAQKRRANLAASIAEDSVRNEFVLHRRIHEKFAAERPSDDLEKLTDWVYEELFKMPANDPWLGLHTPAVVTGLSNNGAQ